MKSKSTEENRTLKYNKDKRDKRDKRGRHGLVSEIEAKVRLGGESVHLEPNA